MSVTPAAFEDEDGAVTALQELQEHLEKVSNKKRTEEEEGKVGELVTHLIYQT